jgi:uncharacterized membrane protein HdeD (DUF308 family)
MAESVITGEVDRVFQRVGITGEAAAILMIVFGILILVFPNLLQWLIGLYLIIVGLLQLMGHMDQRSRAKAAPPPPPPTTLGP